MHAAWSLWVLFAVVACSATDRCPEVCVLDDFECATTGAFNVYKAVVTGTDGVNNNMDPLKIISIETDGILAKAVTDIELKGLSKCTITKLQLRVNNETYQHYVYCPQLVLTFNYEVNSNPLTSAAQVQVSLTSRNYDILNSGEYGVSVSSIDFQPHFYIKSTSTSVDTKAEIKCNTMSIDDDDNFDDELYCTRNVLNIRKIFATVIKSAMKSVFNGIDKNIRSYLMGDVLPRNVTTHFGYDKLRVDTTH